MAVSVLITNLSAAPVALDDLYVTLGAAGSATEALTISRSVSELDSMNNLKSLVDAGTVSAVPTASADNVDLLSCPLEQHGVVAGVDVNAVAVISTAVVFDAPFPAGVVPVVTMTVDKTDGPAARGVAYAENITELGFDCEMDVTTADGGLTVDVNWVATY
jgi:hypothetical protein